MLVVASIRGQAIGAPNINRCKAPVVICSKLLIIYSLIGWERLAGLAGQPSQQNIVHVNQAVILLSHVNKPVTIRTSQPNMLRTAKSCYFVREFLVWWYPSVCQLAMARVTMKQTALTDHLFLRHARTHVRGKNDAGTAWTSEHPQFSTLFYAWLVDCWTIFCSFVPMTLTLQ